MITTIQTRDKGYSEVYGPDNYERTVGDALQMLIKYELGFGGTITNFNSEKPSLTVNTQVLNCHDQTVFTGSKEEMQPLLMAAGMWLEAKKRVDLNMYTQAVLEYTKGAMGPSVWYAGMVLGRLISERFMLIALGISDEATLEQFSALNSKDLLGVLDLLHEGYTPDQIKELIN